MAKRMLIDATHPEETRVVVLNGNRLEEFDFETSTKKQVKGNIYLAKVTRVEPSLQAAFVEYGGNRHGFLAFGEIHADYYRIPVADRRGAEYQHTGVMSSENAGEAADESGVPLEEVLPEPVPVLENDPARDDPAEGEAPSEPGYGVTEDRESGEAVRHAAASHEIRAETRWEEEDSWDTPLAGELPTSQAQSRAFPTTEPVSDEAGEQPGLFFASDATSAPSEPPPVQTWVEVSADDGIVATPQKPAIEPDAEDSIAIVAADQPDPADSHGVREDFKTAARIDTQHLTGGFMAADESAEAGHLSGEIIEAHTTDEAEQRANAGEELIPTGAEDREGDALEPARSSDAEHGEDDFGRPSRPAEEVESDPFEARHAGNGDGAESEIIETLGGDEFEEVETQRSRIHRHYKIQEVIKRRQIMLVQVTKEERGNKGAALTTYLSLAGRYCVLMPNTARGGGVSRKITNLSDRRRLKDILEELEIPEGMGVIVRTAGAERSKAEIKRDYEYLLRLWNEIRELTLRSTAPALIYEEGDLIKRSIRDLYTRDIDEVLVEGEEGYRTAKAFMKMLMPSHAKRVQPYRDTQIGLLHRFQVESQIDAIHSPVVQLRSGGYVVIDQTEALVAIDVNSGRATRERNIEETALRTNLEAAEEIARQLRLRDLAGLIVIDFIDMEEHRNQAAVERRLKEALRNDRARIQVGRISPFGLLEMSRQRLRSSLTEASTQPCPHCGGTGFIRSTESTALYVLRSIEEEGMRRRVAEVCVYVPTTVALYILNHKRDSLAQLETRYGIHVLVARDDTLIPPAFRLERLRAIEPGEAAAIVSPPLSQALDIEEDETEEDFDEAGENEDAEANGRDGEDDRGRGRRRRRRRRRHEDERPRTPASVDEDDVEEPEAALDAATATPEADGEPEGDEDGEAGRLRRRRGRRGGRRRGRRDDAAGSGSEIGRAAADGIEIVPVDADRPGNAAETDERDAAMAARQQQWPQPAGAETLVSFAQSEIETASLPILGGEETVVEAPSAANEIETVGAAATDSETTAEPAPAAPSAACEIEIVSEPPPRTGEGGVTEPLADVPPAAAKIEIVSAPPPAKGDVTEPPETEAPGAEPLAATEIETASLPALAGEGAAAEPAADAAEPAKTSSSETAAGVSDAVVSDAVVSDAVVSDAVVSDNYTPPIWHLAATPGNGEVARAQAASSETGGTGAPADADRSNDRDAVADVAPQAEPAGEAPPSSAAPPVTVESEPTQVVQEVTSKPENPRRGWWQRLIQS